MTKNNRTLYIDIIETISQSIIDDLSAQIEDCRERGIDANEWADTMHEIGNDTVQTMVQALTESYRQLHPELFRNYTAYHWMRKHHGWGILHPPRTIKKSPILAGFLKKMPISYGFSLKP